MSDRLGVSITLFLADGTPDGLRIVEKTGWSGIGMVFARSDLAEVKTRPELRSTGVYVLLGDTEDSGFSKRIYIGEGDEVLARLVAHQGSGSKDFWTTTIVFTSKDANLNKAHARYLESRLVSLATDAKRSEVANATMPQSPPLSERDRAEAEGFLREMLVIFPVLGLDAFERADEVVSARPDANLRYTFSERGAAGEGADRPDGFAVFAGSVAAADETPSCPPFLRRLRQTLRQEGVFASLNGQVVLQQDYVFASPSTAGGVLSGSSVNGRTTWVRPDGVSLKQHQQRMAQDEPVNELDE
ncbi:MAG: GIY-YIG nuclease family protein [Ilumatobacter sp.]|uniref:GIY-YIG nuclease family protein n=1 Tax=Ilumatobacter sp. TaxID=1967498 RepID=UPI003296FAAA